MWDQDLHCACHYKSLNLKSFKIKGNCLVISKLQPFLWIFQPHSADLLTQFSLGILFLNGTPSVTEWNSVWYRSHLLRIVALSRQPDLHGECTYGRLSTGMKSGRRQGASTAPLPVAYGPVSEKKGRVRVLWSRELYWKLNRDCLVSWKNPLLLCSRYWLYRNRKIDFVCAFSSITKINTPPWIREYDQRCPVVLPRDFILTPPGILRRRTHPTMYFVSCKKLQIMRSNVICYIVNNITFRLMKNWKQKILKD